VVNVFNVTASRTEAVARFADHLGHFLDTAAAFVKHVRAKWLICKVVLVGGAGFEPATPAV
jgi:hypothetical protein